MQKLLAVLFLLALFRLSLNSATCRLGEKVIEQIKPCRCKSENNSASDVFTTVFCLAPYNWHEMEGAIRDGLYRHLVDRLILDTVPPKKGERIVFLPDRWLEFVRVKELEVRNTVVAQDFLSVGRPLTGQEKTLQKLTVQNCYLSGALTHNTLGTVHTLGLNEIPHLEYVDLSYNYLTVVTTWAFRYPPQNLSTIVLSNNNIRSVEPDSFIYVAKLAHLDLSHNSLTTVVRKILPSPATFLRTLNLSWNRLLELPTDFFNSLPRLDTVDLSNNFLFALPNKPWDTVWNQLTYVNVTENYIKCDCSLLWLPPRLTRGENATGPHVNGELLGDCLLHRPNLFQLLYRKKMPLVDLTEEDLNC